LNKKTNPEYHLTPIGLETKKVESKFGKGNNKLKELLQRKRFERFDQNLN
jgi:hypothetical protein